jgi:phenylpyruvate tautomerase PptA (4-oxalocrotonate tautomerase family)
MPYIKTTTSVSISDTAKQNLQKKLGEAIALIPGKTEAWLMLAFEDNIRMAFKGDSSEDYAFADVSIFGSASDDAYDRLTAAICEILSEELNIKTNNIYVKYEESHHWGWNGSNF